MFSQAHRPAASFGRHPAQFARWLHAAALLGFWLAVAVATPSVFNQGALPTVGILALYAAVYGRYVSSKLEAQVEAETGIKLEPTWVARAWQGGHRWARALVSRMKPKASLITGSLLVLITLYLGTGIGSCGVPNRGTRLSAASILGQAQT